MNVKRIRKGLVLVSALAMFGLGCELIVDFDRTKIPVEATEGGAADAASDTTPPSDAPVDSPVDSGGDTSKPDADAGDGEAGDAAGD